MLKLDGIQGSEQEPEKCKGLREGSFLSTRNHHNLKEQTMKLSKVKGAKGRYLSRHLLSGRATQSVKTIQ